MKIIIATTITVLCTFLLNAQGKNYEEWYLTTADSISIFVKEITSTSKDTVIVVHGGFGANHDYMLDAIKGLEKKFHFILYDQRGSLLSPAPVGKLTFQKNVNDLYELVTELKLKKVKLLCHSMGTLIGMEFAKQHPDLIDKLVLTGALIPKADSISSVFSERSDKHIAFLTSRKEALSLQDKYVKIDREKKRPLTDKELTDSWRIYFASVNIYQMKNYKNVKGGKAYYKNEASVMAETVDWNYDYRSLLNSLNATVIQGQYDFLDFNLTTYKEQIKGYTNIQTKIIPNAGHNSWIDSPELFKKYLFYGLTN